MCKKPSSPNIEAVLNKMLQTGTVHFSKRTARTIRHDLSWTNKLFRSLRVTQQKLKSLPTDGTPQRIVAGMATMPSREHTFNLAYASLIRSVDHLYLYLDGHEDVPKIVRNDSRVTPVFSHEKPGLHANGKLIGLNMEPEDCIYVCADDDIYFTSNFVPYMRRVLAQYQDRAIVGLHTSVFVKPFTSYKKSQSGVSIYAGLLADSLPVDIIGTGAAMFSSAVLSVNAEEWPKVSMTDLRLAIEAEKQGIPLYGVARKRALVATIEEAQEDSLFLARSKDDSLQTEMCEELLSLKEKIQPSHG